MFHCYFAMMRYIDKKYSVIPVRLFDADSLYSLSFLFLFLTGFVTDHINLLQDHSKLYHYLAVFEEDSKRKIAMESRRVQLLLPLLTSLNRSAFDNLHKQVSGLNLDFVIDDLFVGLHSLGYSNS
jgi:KIF-1 binding protein C terminal